MAIIGALHQLALSLRSKVMNGRIQLVTLFLLGVGIFAFFLLFVHRAGGGDDVVLPAIAKNYNLLEWIAFRYQYWSGRIFAESYVYIFGLAPLVLWKVVSVAHYALLLFFIYKYYTLSASIRSAARDRLMMLLIAVVLFGMNIGVFIDASFWVTGALNYLWIVSLAVPSLYPVIALCRGNKVKPVYWMASWLASFVAAASQEQVGLALIAITFALLAYAVYAKCRRSIRLFLVSLLVPLAGFLVSYLAPGNKMRIKTEIADRLPDFLTVSFADRINYSYRWFLDAIINHTGILLIVIWVLLCILLYKKRHTIQRTLLIGLLGSALVFSIVKSSVGSIFNFYAHWGLASFPLESYVVLMYWTVVLIATVISLIYAFARTRAGLVCALLFTVSLIATGAMVLSPTMYESGLRVVYVSSVMLAILAVMLTAKVIDSIVSSKDKAMVVLLIALFPMYQVVKLSIMYVLNGFQIHLPW